jgi:hypothetical protein
LLENIAAEDPTMEDERLTKSKVFQANEDYVNDLVMQARFLFGSGFDPMVQYFCGTTKKLEVKGK